MRDFDTFDENLQYVVEVKNENLDEEGYATLIINLIQKGSEKKSIGKFLDFVSFSLMSFLIKEIYNESFYPLSQFPFGLFPFGLLPIGHI